MCVCLRGHSLVRPVSVASGVLAFGKFAVRVEQVIEGTHTYTHTQCGVICFTIRPRGISSAIGGRGTQCTYLNRNYNPPHRMLCGPTGHTHIHPMAMAKCARITRQMPTS